MEEKSFLKSKWEKKIIYLDKIWMKKTWTGFYIFMQRCQYLQLCNRMHSNTTKQYRTTKNKWREILCKIKIGKKFSYIWIKFG